MQKINKNRGVTFLYIIQLSIYNTKEESKKRDILL